MGANLSMMNSYNGHVSHRARRFACAAISGWLLFTTPVFAAVGALDPFSDLNRVSETKLDDMRGGFRVNGFEMRFGMRVESAVSGIGRVVTLLTWGDLSRKWTPTSTTVYSADGTQQSANPNAAVPAANAQLPAAPQSLSTAANTAVSPPVPVAPPAPTGLTVPTVPTAPTVASVIEPTISVPTAASPPQIANTPETVTPPVATSLPVSVPVPQSVANYLDQQATQPSAPTLGQKDGGFELTVANSGTTQILHQITEGHVAALISNQENGVTISQSTTLDVGVANFAQQMANAMHVIRARSVVGSGVNRY
jgi:hypothetical protein